MMRAFAATIKANVPTLLWGPPGVGKTAIVEAMGREAGFDVETVIGSVREPADFLGMPMEGKDDHGDPTTVYAPVSWATRLGSSDKGLLFLDELTTAAPSTMKAMLRVMQEREVGEYKLPDSVVIVAAANPPDIAVDGWELSAPIANRMCHMDWHVGIDAWMDGFMDGFATPPSISINDLTGPGKDEDVARTRGLVAAFLRHRPDLLSACPTDPEVAGKGWPSPRSWTNAAAILANLRSGDDDAQLLVLKGCVGDGAATEFLAWIAVSDLAAPDDVMNDPSIVNWKRERPDRLFALITSVTALATMRDSKDAYTAAFEVMGACAAGDRPDVAAPGVIRLARTMPQGVMIPARVADKFSDLLSRIGR